MRKEIYKRRHVILSILLYAAFIQFSISSIYGPVLFPDEIGYWGVAAATNGYDWSEVVSLNSYYSYGYGILLGVIVNITDNAVLAYRIAICFNFFLMGISLLLLNKILKRLFVQNNRNIVGWFSICGICYCTFIFLMQTGMAEILLMTLYLCIIYLLLSYLEDFKSLTAVKLVILFVYLYFVHMRTIAIIIAAIMIAIIFFVIYPQSRQSLKVAAIAVVISAGIGLYVKDWMTDTLYALADINTLAGNDYAGQIDKICGIFSFSGALHFWVSIIGKMLYLGISTFGVIYWSLFFLVKKAILFFRTRDKKNAVYCFLLLAFAGQFAITAIYMTEGTTIDTTLYGRYHEMVLPIMIAIGLREMFETKEAWKKTFLIVGVQSTFLGIVALYWNYTDSLYRHSLFIVGANFAANQENFKVGQFVGVLFLAGILFCVLITELMCFIKKKKQWTWLLGILALLQILIGLDAAEDYIYFHNRYNYTDILLGQELQQLAEEEKEIYFLPSDDAERYIGLIQMSLMKYPIRVLENHSEEVFAQDGVILAFQNSPDLEHLEDIYDRKKEARLFTAFYNP